MRGTYDKQSDSAYLHLVDEVGAGRSKKQSVVAAEGLRSSTIVLDFDEEGYLLGIEVLEAADILRGDTIGALKRID